MATQERERFYDDEEQRLRELILYIAELCQDKQTFSSTMLNKVLFFSDFMAYGKYGKPITGARYVKLPYGPVPDGIETIKTKMRSDGDIAVVDNQRFNRTQKRVVALRPADIGMFDGNQIAMVAGWAHHLCQFSAKDVSDMSHDRAWKAAAVGETIPYAAVFISDEPITNRDRYWTEKIGRDLGWTVIQPRPEVQLQHALHSN